MHNSERARRARMMLIVMVVCIGVALMGEEAVAQESEREAQFKKVTEKLDTGGNLFVYMSTGRMGSQLLEKLGVLKNMIVQRQPEGRAVQNLLKRITLIQKLIRQSGLLKLGAMGVSSVRQSSGVYRNKIVLQGTGSGMSQKLWKVFGGKSHQTPGPELFPASTIAASYGNVDLQLLGEFANKFVAFIDEHALKSRLSRIKAKVRKSGLEVDEIIDSFAGQCGFAITMNYRDSVKGWEGPKKRSSSGTMRGMVIFKMERPVVFAHVKKITKSNPRVEHEQSDDLDMVYAIPRYLPPSIRPTVAHYRDYIILASHHKIVRNAVQVAEGKAKGLYGTEKFAKLAEGLPQNGGQFIYMSSKMGRVLRNMLKRTVQQPESSEAPPVVEFMEKLMGPEEMIEFCLVTRASEKGLVSTINTNISGATLVVKQGLAAPIAVYGAMLMPALARARREALKNACINNLMTIGAGIAMYRNTYGEFPPSLAKLRETTVQSSDIFLCPATDKTETVNGLKTAYKYVGKLPEGLKPLTIIAYDRKGNHRGGRNCLFGDMHVKFVPEEEFQSGESDRSLKQSYKKVLKAYGDDLTPERKEELKDFYKID